MKIKSEVVVFAKFIRAFGFIRGPIIYLRFKMKNPQQFRVPNIKSPIHLRREATDRKVFYELFVDLERKYLAYCGHPETIVDGGANIGLNTIIYKNAFPATEIVCIEPDPENIKALSRNVNEYHQVHIENAGLWNKVCRLKVYDKYGFGKSGIVVEENQEGSIQAVSIPYLMEKYGWDHIDLLKLDIETSEKILFYEGYADWLSKVKVIYIELHDRVVENCAKTFFTAINSTYAKYEMMQFGENTMIINLDFKPS